MEKTIKEKKDYLENQQRLDEKFSAIKSALMLADLSRTETRSFNSFSKDKLRTFMKNPMANSTNILQLSRFLYRLCYSYRRMVYYNAEMIDLTAVSVIPTFNLAKGNPDSKQIKKQYFNTLSKMDQMHLNREILKLLLIAWREDCVYGYVYDDGDTFFIHILDGQYCKVSSMEDGILNFAFDFSYFSNHKTDLEYWDSEFSKGYNAYNSDSTKRWQELPPEKTICLKVNIDDPTLVLPPFSALFESIIDLIDLQSIQSVKNELSVYKMLIATLPTRPNAEEPDDFTVDIETAIEYYNKLATNLPSCVTSAISPIPITPIEFKGNTTEDVDMISNATNNLFKSSGGSQILNNEDISGSTAYNASILSDTQMAIRILLPQIETWMNRYIGYTLKNHSKIKYLEVSPYTKAEKKKSLLESGQNGIPVKLAIASLDGYSPLEILSLQYLENDVLELHKSWIPLSTSYTQSGSAADPNNTTDPITGGRPQQDDITEEGEASRDGEKQDLSK